MLGSDALVARARGRVLVVDDDRPPRRGATLLDAGWKVDTAPDGRAALAS